MYDLTKEMVTDKRNRVRVTAFAKGLILDFWLGSKCPSGAKYVFLKHKCKTPFLAFNIYGYC